MPSPTDAGPSRWWWCLALGPADRPVWFAVVGSERHPGATLVELPVDEAEVAVGEDVVCRVHYGPDVMPGRVEPPTRPEGAPPLWFHEVPEPTATPPASNLVAFTGHGVAEGTLATPAMVRSTGVTSADQVAAVRWYPATGEVDQIYVSPAHRRRGVATALTVVGGVLSLARGQARWWGDGQRTALGERWVRASPWLEATRVAPQTHLAPPMTPYEER